MNGCRLWLEGRTRRNRIRPIPRPCSSAATATIALSSVGRPRTPSSSVGFIHLHTAVEPIPVGPDHRTPQLVDGCLVAAQAEHLLQPQRTPSGFLVRTTSPETTPQGLLRPFKNRPRRQRGSAPTLSTLQAASIGRQASLPAHCGHRKLAAAAETPDTPLPGTNRCAVLG